MLLYENNNYLASKNNNTVEKDIFNECMFLSEGRKMKDSWELFKLDLKASMRNTDEMGSLLKSKSAVIEKYKQLGETKNVKKSLFELYQYYRVNLKLVPSERDEILAYILKEVEEIKSKEPDFDFLAEFKRSGFATMNFSRT